MGASNWRERLTPLQRQTLELLERRGDPVYFDLSISDELRATINEGLAELAQRVPAPPPDRPTALRVNKFDLSQVLTCERCYAAKEAFSWSPQTARGSVAHRAIQLGVNWRDGEPVPALLVDEAITRLRSEERAISEWLDTIDPATRADVRSAAVERASKFFEAFPPLQPQWRPTTEATTSYPPAGPIVLVGRVDLTLGGPRGDESTKVLIDVKTGRHHPRHRDDLRFYALLETLTRRVPPRLMVSYSLESCAADIEPVDEARLRSTVRRVLDAIERMIELDHEQRSPTQGRHPGCRFAHELPDDGVDGDELFDDRFA